MYDFYIKLNFFRGFKYFKLLEISCRAIILRELIITIIFNYIEHILVLSYQYHHNLTTLLIYHVIFLWI